MAIYTPGSIGRPAADRAAIVRRPAAGARGGRRGLARPRDVGRLGPAWRSWASTPIRSAAASTSCSPTSSTHAWRDGRDLDLAGLIRDIQTPPFDKVGVMDLESFFPAKDRVGAGDAAQQPARLAVVRRLDGGRAARCAAAAVHGRGQAAAVDPLDRPPVRRRADVLRHDPAQRGARLDAHAAGHLQPAGDPLHGRGVRLLSADGQSAVQDADAHAAQAGAGVRPGRRAGHAEPGRSRLQGPLQRRHVVPRPAANRARQGPRARRPGRGLGRRPARRSTAERWSRRWPAWATACS